MKMWKGNGNTNTLLFSLKGLEILQQETRVGLLSEHHSYGTFQQHPFSQGPANKQYTN